MVVMPVDHSLASLLPGPLGLGRGAKRTRLRQLPRLIRGSVASFPVAQSSGRICAAPRRHVFPPQKKKSLHWPRLDHLDPLHPPPPVFRRAFPVNRHSVPDRVSRYYPKETSVLPDTRKGLAPSWIDRPAGTVPLLARRPTLERMQLFWPQLAVLCIAAVSIWSRAAVPLFLPKRIAVCVEPSTANAQRRLSLPVPPPGPAAHLPSAPFAALFRTWGTSQNGHALTPLGRTANWPWFIL
ncbi:uncharacterized protein LY79DRAFT_358132 [Colletotrichum navitas]|uniref:Uncharacterized protein n=1 Tax=Colletotrichum navitas TaxID=681940 RepID=A0AAD8PS74_9PEZI|nr:uncharacterized protein LY79DRAFT_358132 [Colletotrichum navitas]KAK1579180.1 hypothetical protein LY79DRAFT_358132 [Colletotrichum navitas]